MNKTIIITGASSGIGKATAESLISTGANLVLASRKIEKIQKFAEKYPDSVLLHKTDVTKKDDVDALVEAAKQRFGSVDVLINNAGLGSFRELQMADTNEWDTMIDTNIKGVLYCFNAVLPHMITQEKGHIINIASVAAHDVFPNAVVYCATKHAVLAISKGIRLEFQDKIKVTTISPGAVNTGFLENTLSTEEDKEERREYFKEGLTPDVIAQNIRFAIEQPDEVAISEIIVRPQR
ncbi:SDR family oxidoreductase [Xanthovirga aplysinae]|uniref:SDR family oxidoreductase n=1 Tax=Xanthovirga aplysinae TaxID=2529853 RepID=UPI0012BD19EF|nr:SDR family oxidoreductase [Xanthovirga aplysinae]MTI33522.1 SDR family oxidoreductase [Xanthovirga aplysinae]